VAVQFAWRAGSAPRTTAAAAHLATILATPCAALMRYDLLVSTAAVVALHTLRAVPDSAEHAQLAEQLRCVLASDALYIVPHMLRSIVPGQALTCCPNEQ
jgi:hypothetical protein